MALNSRKGTCCEKTFFAFSFSYKINRERWKLNFTLIDAQRQKSKDLGKETYVERSNK